MPATIRRARKRLKKTLRDVARDCAVSEPTVWAWEKGQQQPRLDRLPVIARSLGLDVADLVKGMR